MTGLVADATLTTLSVTELLFWTVTFVVLGLLLWRVRDRKLDLPRTPLLILATFFLASHFFFDTYDDYLEIEPGQGVPAAFLARAGIEALETLGFLFLILISLRVREAGHTIERQKEQLELAYRQLLQAAKLASVGELASGIAHEINNPIGIILGRTDYILATQHDLSVEAKADLKVVRNQAERVASTVRSLLTFARPSPLSIQRVDLTQLVDQVIALEAPRCNSGGIKIERPSSGRILTIRADPDRLQQVLVNLMNNAIDAMPQGGRLGISITNGGGGEVAVNISDTGTGITEANQARIFDPFFTTKPAGKGTGLGLAVSYGIIRDHGGEIRMSSIPDKGSTFSIMLPMEDNGHGDSGNGRG
jgi:two-component system NtrC family sensor kinase